MALYGASSCSGPFTEIDYNDDYTGLNPGLTITGLSASHTYYIRFWSLGLATGYHLTCISNPTPPPSPINPAKGIGINYDYPETNLDINGNVSIRGGNPQAGRLLVSTNNQGRLNWKDIQQVNQKKMFKLTLSQNQTGTTGPVRVRFDKKEFNIGNGYDTANFKYVINVSIGSIYLFNLTTVSSGSNSNYYNIL